MGSPRIICGFIAVFFLSACAVLPKNELVAYADSVANTKAAGDLILDEVSAVLVTDSDPKATSCARNAQGYRPCFRVEFALGEEGVRVNEHPDIQVRRLALAVLETYSEILLDVSAGRPASVIAQRGKELGALNTAVTALFAGTGVVLAELPIAGVTNIAERLVTAATQNAASRSVLKLEPDIRSLIGLMIDDTPALYAVYVSQFVGSVRQTSIALNRARLDGKTEEQARLQRKLDALRSPQGNAAKAILFENALTDYVKLLDRSDKTLVSLREAVTLETVNSVERSTEFVRRATETRILLESVLTDLKDLRDKDR
ncbi:hypothetical protein [Roseobacter sp.]|uniref:hypothetical protein n=1 Tax=Roseobacter sp. TaxID=1907202 RepID=UPI002966ED53|nr:hypothetical protein [Roseobacter sp.]MDW3183380.1 hypothetical protein [Roseobacter sp.]